MSIYCNINKAITEHYNNEEFNVFEDNVIEGDFINLNNKKESLPFQTFFNEELNKLYIPTYVNNTNTLIKDAEKKEYLNNFPSSDNTFFDLLDKRKQTVTTNIYDELGIENENILPLMSPNAIELYNKVKDKTKLTVKLDGSNAYDFNKKEITISLAEVKALSEASGISSINILEQSFRHELRHALSHFALETDVNDNYTSKLTYLFSVAEKNIPSDFNDVLRQGFKFSNGNPYALQYTHTGMPNLHEFLTEAFENDDFRKYLKSIYSDNTNLWQKLLKWIDELFNTSLATTIYDQITEIYNSQIFKENNKIDEIDNIEDMFISYHGLNANPRTFYEKMEDDLISLNVANYLKDNINKFIDSNKNLYRNYSNEIGAENEATAAELRTLFLNQGKYVDKISYLIRDMVLVSETIGNMESSLKRELLDLKNQPNSYNQQLLLISKAKSKLDSLSEFFEYLTNIRNSIIESSPSKSLKYLLDSSKLTGNETAEEKKEKEQKAVTIASFIRLLEYPIAYKSFIDNLISSEIKSPILGLLKEQVKSQDVIDAQNDIARYKALANEPNKTLAQKTFLLKKADTLQKRLEEELLHNEEWFEKHLTDYTKDVNMIVAAVNAASQSDSPIVQYMHNIFTNIDSEAVRENLPIANNTQTQIDAFLKATGKTNMSTDIFDPILETVTDVLELNDDLSVKKSIESLAFIGEATREYYQALQMYRLKFDKLDTLRKAAKNDTEQKAIEAQINDLYIEQGKFQQEHSLRYYVDEWYDNENLLKQEVVNEKGETVPLKSIKNDYYDQIKMYEEIITSSDDEATITLNTDLLKETRVRLKQLTETEGKEEGSNEYKIAKILQTYSEVRKKFGSSKITNKTYAYFKNLVALRKEQLRKKIITQQEYNEWMQKNSTTKISETWYNDIKTLSTEVDEISKEIAEFLNDSTLKSDLSGYYQVIKDLSRSYRDEDGVLQGSLVDENRRSVIKKNQEELENISRNVEKVSGLSKEENKRVSDLFSKVKNASISDNESVELTQLLEKKKRKEAAVLPIKDKLLKLKAVREKIAKLSSRSLTDEYHKIYSEQKNSILAKLPLPGVKSDYKISDVVSIQVYDLEDGTIDVVKTNLGKPSVSLYTGVRDNVMLQDLVKNEQAIEKLTESDWYNENHYLKITYDEKNKSWIEEMTPIYVWNHTLPSDEEYIENEYPNSKYYRFEHNEASKNPNYKTTPDGMALPKLTSKYYNQKLLTLEKPYRDLLEFSKEIHYANLIRAGVSKWRYSNFIPTSRITTSERRVNFVSNFGSNTMEWLKDTFTKKDTDLLEEGITAKDNKFDTIPAYFTAKLNASEQSKNIPGLLLMSDITSRKREKFLKIKFFADELVNMTQPPRLKKQLHELNRTNLYGETTKSTGLKIGNVSVDKLVNQIFGLTGFKLFAGNIISPVQNKGGAFLQQIIESNKRNGMYGNYTWAFAEKEFGINVPKLINDHTKFANKSLLGQKLDFFSVMSGSRVDALGNKTQWNAVKNITEVLTAPKDLSEFQVQVTQFIAFAKTQKIPNTEISVYDAYEINKQGNLALKPGIVFSEKDINEFILKLQQMQLKINGAYRTNQKSVVEKELLGKAAFFMNQYIVPLYTNQFSTGRYNYAEGRWMRGIQVEGVSKLITLFKDYKLINAVEWHKDLSETEKADFTRFVKNNMVVAFTTILLAILMGGDDDKDRSQAEKLALVYVMRISSEIQTFNPIWGTDEMLRKMKNPFTLVGTLIQARNAMYYGLLTAYGDEDAYYKKRSGHHDPGDSKLMAILYRFMAASPSTILGLDIDTLYKMQKSMYKGGNLR